MPLPFDVPLPRSPSIDLVRAALTRRRLSQRDLAEKTGIAREQLGRILAGKVAFPRSPRVLAKLAEALGLDPAEFSEYRERLDVLPESTRRLLAHLEARGMTVEQFKGRVTRLGADQIQWVLAGGAPFPTDPTVIQDLARAAEAEPFLFGEYLPLDRLANRLREAASRAMGPAQAEAFQAGLAAIAAWLDTLPVAEFDEGVVAHMARSTDAEDSRGALRAFLPRWEDLQPEVQHLVAGLERRGWSPRELAQRAEADPDELLAILKGQLKLKDPQLTERLNEALEAP